jgi:hypothetical protein
MWDLCVSVEWQRGPVHVRAVCGTGLGVLGGIVEQVKVPSKIAQQPLGEMVNSPVAAGESMLLAPDLSKFDRPPLLHVTFRALDVFAERHGGTCGEGARCTCTTLVACGWVGGCLR